jgi:hypothetical protein
MPRTINITGQRSGRLVAIRPVSYDDRGNVCWLCKCDCGNYSTVPAFEIKRGGTRSCGCVIVNNNFNYKHGHTKNNKVSSEYTAWQAMHNRCKNPNVREYKRYGARGIKVCQRWSVFEKFLADVGLRPHAGLSLDRINNDGDYEPGNVKWSTPKEQANNRRKPKKHD